MTTLYCPRCHSDDVLVYEQSSYYVNSGEFFCHSSKTHDDDADCRCTSCDWSGIRADLVTAEET